MTSDEELMQRVASEDPEAMKSLHAKYAPLLFHLGTQSLDPHAAEDLVQEVFLQVWRRASTFDPGRGAFRAWLLQIAHFRILNELRRRSRQPQIGANEEAVLEWPDPSPEPQESSWREFRKTAVRAAVDRLPTAQRQALSLAFFEELSHDQVAAALRLPLGTVKTRIRSALLKLRGALAPLAVAALLAGVGAAGWLLGGRTDRALALVSSSHAEEHRLAPAPEAPSATHGWYKNRPGTATAVLALHLFPKAAPGMVYQGWVRLAGQWVSVGTTVPDAEGNAVIVAEGAVFGNEPEAVLVTREPWTGGRGPEGTVIVRWEGNPGPAK
jgi:RNA polymerase sigma-70 factor (ECF subfamily)